MTVAAFLDYAAELVGIMDARVDAIKPSPPPSFR
jgi:hypothetical protein